MCDSLVIIFNSLKRIILILAENGWKCHLSFTIGKHIKVPKMKTFILDIYNTSIKFENCISVTSDINCFVKSVC